MVTPYLAGMKFASLNDPANTSQHYRKLDLQSRDAKPQRSG
jgi:hypothetical protein